MRLGDIAALGEGGDAVGGAEGEGFDSHGRLAAAGGYEAAAVAEEEIFYVVGAVIGIDDGGFGVVAHAAGAEEMHGELRFLDGLGPLLYGAGGVQKLIGALVLPGPELEVVGVILVGEAERGEAPGVFEVGVEGEAVGFYGEGGAVAKQLHGAREIVRESVLEGLAPGGRAGRQTTHGEGDRRGVETSVNATATVEADLLRI